LPAYRLHYFPESGNSYKIALMLTLCSQTFEPIWTDFGGGVTRTAEWRSAVNEMGEIPVLEEDGQRYTQTAPLLLRLAERYGRFGGRDESEQFEILRWLFWDNHKLTGYVYWVLEIGVCRQVDDGGPLADHKGLLRKAPLEDESGYDFAASHPAINP
jgi:hypothetical protein